MLCYVILYYIILYCIYIYISYQKSTSELTSEIESPKLFSFFFPKYIITLFCTSHIPS